MAEKSRVKEVAVKGAAAAVVGGAAVEADVPELAVVGGVEVLLLLLQAPATRPAPMASTARARVDLTG
jgi:hypothetical protein